MNTPYVVKRNDLGEITNPIKDSYLNMFENRKQIREKMYPKRFRGNHKGISLSFVGFKKFYRVVQIIRMKNGTKKRIEHYLTH